MWPDFIHHLSLHFPIVLSLVLLGVGGWSLKHDTPELRAVVRVIGWIAVALTTVAVVSGILAAPGWFGGEGSQRLSHHRYLGLTTWVCALLAALAYERGQRLDERDWRALGVGLWCVVAFGAIGTGHWGGSEEHSEVVPWMDEAPGAPQTEP